MAISVLVHLGLFAAGFAPHAPAGVTGGAADGGAPGVSVTLVRWASSAAPVPAVSSETERLERLRVQLTGAIPAAPDAQPPKPPANPQALLQAFDQARQPSASGSSEARLAAAGSPGSVSVLDDPMAQVSVPAAAFRAPGQFDLWPQLAHCWRPGRAFPVVRLAVSLDDRGGLQAPPRVVRDPALKPDQNRLEAEGEAIRAVIACAPYAAARGVRRAFQLEFKPQAG